jgi:hypothetical protein
MWCHNCDKNNHNTADCRAIAKAKQLKMAILRPKLLPERSHLRFFSKKSIRQKKLNIKFKFQNSKIETLRSNEINLTTTSDEDEEYFPFFSSLHRIKSNKLAKTAHPTSELVVSLKN